MRGLGSVAAVIAAIREDAAADVEAIERRTEAEIARGAAEEATDVVVLPERESRLSAARERARARLAQEDWQDSREALAEREQWIARAHALGQQCLTEPDPPDGRAEMLARFTREGLDRLPAGPVEVLVSAADAALLGPDWCRAIAAGSLREELRVVISTIEGGCVIRTADGRASYDNTCTARARRFEATWRAALGELYEQAQVPASASTPRESRRG
jgi:vacuolar-type H+-ATPase subunit E/Vma4